MRFYGWCNPKKIEETGGGAGHGRRPKDLETCRSRGCQGRAYGLLAAMKQRGSSVLSIETVCVKGSDMEKGGPGEKVNEKLVRWL